MSSDFSKRFELLQAFGRTFRELSTVVVFFHTVIAERLGLKLTDHKAFEIVDRKGAVTARELAELTGLTTGAITGVIDRLEKAGFVRREQDPGDRRKVIIRPHPDTESKLKPLYESLGQAIVKGHSRYSDEELELILDYLTGGIKMLQEESLKLRRVRQGDGSATDNQRPRYAPKE